jgi:hypothetical protein
MYRVSHLTWNPPGQQPSAAASKLPGNNPVTTQNLVVLGSELRGTRLAINCLDKNIGRYGDQWIQTWKERRNNYRWYNLGRYSYIRPT